MGVIAIGAIAGLGALGGFMGSQGKAAQQKAQYEANRIQVERNNFQQNLANDKKNFATARANAMRKFNNKQITKKAFQSYGDAKFQSRQAFQARATTLANNQIQMESRLQTEALGKNLRGGMVERMETVAREQAKASRINNRKAKFSQDLQDSVNYENVLSQRDMLSYGQASIFIPGSTGVMPGGQKLDMLTGIIGGGISGASSGIGIAGGLNNLGISGVGVS